MNPILKTDAVLVNGQSVPVPVPSVSNNLPSVTLVFEQHVMVDVADTAFVLTKDGRATVSSVKAGDSLAFQLDPLPTPSGIVEERYLFLRVKSAASRAAELSWLTTDRPVMLYLTNPYAFSPCTKLSLVLTYS